MVLSKKLYLVFFLILAVSLLSYISFQYYPLPKPVDSSVKGAAFSGPFAFLPIPEDALGVSSNYSTEGMTASYFLERPCLESDHFFYETILLDAGWNLDLSKYVDRFLLRSYSKDFLSLQVQTTEEIPDYGAEGSRCLVTLIGRSD